jgi:uncharacterized protein YkwD
MRKGTIAATLAVVGLTLALAPAASACRCENKTATTLSLDGAQSAITRLINQRRRHNRLKLVRPDAALAASARHHSEAMTSQDFFGHSEGGDGTPASRAVAAGYVPGGSDGWNIGENIGFGSGSLGSPRAMVRAWMASPMHRTVILMRGWRDIGVGVSFGSPMGPDDPGAATYTLDLAHR